MAPLRADFGIRGLEMVEVATVTGTLTLALGRTLDADTPGLLDAARRGDAAAQASLFSKHKERVARQILRMTGDAGSVDDLVQEVFVAAFRNLQAFRGDAEVETWLYRITLNKVRNWWASNRRRRLREAKSAPPLRLAVTESLEAHAEASDALEAFYRALGELPHKYREAFVARAIDELSLEDAAARLGVPVSTVSYRARQAEAQLRKVLGWEAPP